MSIKVESAKWKGKTGGGNFGQKFIVFLFKHFNLRIGYGIMYFIMPFYFVFGCKARKSVLKYLRKALGFGGINAICKAWKIYVNFAKIMLDRFSVFAGHGKEFKITENNVNIFDQYTSKEKGFILLGSHTGSFELCGYLLHQNQKKIYTLVYGGEGGYLTENRTKVLNKNNIIPIAITNDMQHLFTINQALDNGNIVSLAADRILGSNKSKELDFLNAKADFPIGPFATASIKDVDVLAVFAFRTGYCKYEVNVFKIEKDLNYQTLNNKLKAESLMKKYVEVLESQVRKYPLQWFNFYDYFK